MSASPTRSDQRLLAMLDELMTDTKKDLGSLTRHNGHGYIKILNLALAWGIRATAYRHHEHSFGTA
jgi:hypothetical protein